MNRDKTEFVENADMEISFRDLFFFVFKQWRLVFYTILAFIIGSLIITLVPLIKTWNNEESMSASIYYYNSALSAYMSKAEALEREIDTASANLTKQTDYNAESIRMKIDPYHELVAQLTFYIDSGYRIIPENTYQDIDYSSRLIKMYMAYLTNGNAYSQLMAQFPEISDEQYISEIMKASSDDLTSTITLTVVGNDQETAWAMLDVIRAGMQEVYAEASDVIGRHSLSEIDASIYTAVDTALAEEQQGNYEQSITLSDYIKKKNLELETLINEGEPRWEFSWWKITTRLVKAALIAAALGWLVSVFALAMYYIVSDKILDVEKLQSLSGVSILGVIPQTNPKRMTLLDRAVARFSGVKQQAMNRDAALVVAAHSIYAAALAKGIANGGVVLAGSIGAEALRELADALSGAVADA